MKDKIKVIILATSFIVFLASLIGFIINFINGFGCQYVWLLSAMGWLLLTILISSLLKLENFTLSENHEVKKNG